MGDDASERGMEERYGRDCLREWLGHRRCCSTTHYQHGAAAVPREPRLQARAAWCEPRPSREEPGHCYSSAWQRGIQRNEGPLTPALHPLTQPIGQSRVEEAGACTGRAALCLFLGAALRDQSRETSLFSEPWEHVWFGRTVTLCVVLAPARHFLGKLPEAGTLSSLFFSHGSNQMF